MTLRGRVVSGFSWSAVGRGFRESMQLLCMIVLARFLNPADFGAYAIVMLFINLISIFGSAGSSQILIMKQGESPQLATTLFYLNLVFGLFAYMVLLACSSDIATFFAEPEMEPLLDIAGLAFLIQAPILVQRSLMERDLRFKALVRTEMITILIAAALGVVGAVNGMGVYSLLVFNLSSVVMLAVSLWFVCSWRPTGRPDLRVLSETMPLVFQFTGFSLMNFFSRHADVFLIGRLIGSGALGLYSIAYRLTLYPVQALSQVVHRVAYPTLSGLRDKPDSAREFYLRCLQGVTLVVFPALLGLGCIAGFAVPLVLGPQWGGMVATVQILLWVGLLQVVTATVGTIYPAMEKTRLMLLLGVLNLVIVVGAFLLGIPYGIEGVALAYLAANLLMFFLQIGTAWPLLGLTVRVGLATIAPALIASLIMSVLVMGLGALGHRLDVPDVFTLALQVAAGAMSYPLVLWWLFRPSFAGFVTALRSTPT